MIDRTDVPEMSSSAASRRAFRSKVDSIRPTYGFEDVSLAPGTDPIEPADVDLSQLFCGIDLTIPILASAMDAVVDTRMAGELARLGGLAVLNLEGVQSRFDDPAAILERIATTPRELADRSVAVPVVQRGEGTRDERREQRSAAPLAPVRR